MRDYYYEWDTGIRETNVEMARQRRRLKAPYFKRHSI